MDVHTWFSLSYANYAVLPRTLLQSMPEEWQERFVVCMEELREAFAHVPQAEAYDVTAGREVEVGSLSASQRDLLGVTLSDDDDPNDPRTFYDRDGDEMEGWHRVLLPERDPVPPYNRGRTHIEPAAKVAG